MSATHRFLEWCHIANTTPLYTPYTHPTYYHSWHVTPMLRLVHSNPATHHGHLLRLIEFNDDYAEYFSTGDGGGGGNTIDVAGDEITEILNIIRIDA